jgi:hypothetical protein
MASMMIDFTGAPIKITGTSAFAVYQPITQVIDLGGRFRVLDLICNVYSYTGTTPSFTVSILTGTQSAVDGPIVSGNMSLWPSLGQFTNAFQNADTSQMKTFTGAARFVRYKVDVTAGGSVTAYLDIKGVARTSE